MSDRTCGVVGCDRPARARGWCKNHWQNWRRHGSPHGASVALIPDLPGERWLPVVGYEGLYEVSDWGRVKSLDKIVPTFFGSRLVRGRLLIQSPSQYGHPQVSLYRNGESITAKVHRVVGEAFLGPLPVGEETRHGPGGRQDNRLSNLSYGTTAENAGDRLRDGTHREGEVISWAKLTDDIVRECRTRYAAGVSSCRLLAAEFGVSPATMHKALTGRNWRHVDR